MGMDKLKQKAKSIVKHNMEACEEMPNQRLVLGGKKTTFQLHADMMDSSNTDEILTFQILNLNFTKPTLDLFVIITEPSQDCRVIEAHVS